MNKTRRYIKALRMFKASVIGLFTGAIILCACITPSFIQNRVEASAAAVRQDSLTASRGEAFNYFDMADISFTVLLDGMPHYGMSVAADRGFWAVPPDGQLELSLAPNTYRFTAAFENRRLIFTGEVFAGQVNEFVLDVGKTPFAPELRILEISADAGVTIPLEIANADEVTSPNLRDGVSIVKINGVFSLLVEEGALSPGFYCFPLTAENMYGQTSSYFCLRITDEIAVTPIYTATQMSAVRNNLSGHYVLMNDIDMSGVDDWIPIGTESYPFTGILDGGGHEITGFHAPAQISEGATFALFGFAKNAEFRNVVFRDSVITPEVPTKELRADFKCSVLCVVAFDSMVENCGSFGGILNPSDGWASGLIVGVNYCVVLDCFNSADIISTMPNNYLPNTGGITGGAYFSYIARCSNEGEIKGNHLSGGISGHAAYADITRCINSGYIWGSTIVGAVPAGGIVQSNDYGTVRYSYFTRGLAAIGAHCIDGAVVSIVPITVNELRAQDKLSFLGTFSGETPEWSYASLDAHGPVPYGVFKEQAAAPNVTQAEGHITIPPAEGVWYFYTTDGSDPYTNCTEPVRELSLTPKNGQTLRIFAAKQGCRDSELITVTGGK